MKMMNFISCWFRSYYFFKRTKKRCMRENFISYGKLVNECEYTTNVVVTLSFACLRKISQRNIPYSWNVIKHVFAQYSSMKSKKIYDYEKYLLLYFSKFFVIGMYFAQCLLPFYMICKFL